jgi:hypothetical protein
MTMKRFRPLTLITVLSILLVLTAPQNTAAQSSTEAVEKALAYLRQIDPAKVTAADEEKVAKEINAAWKTIQQAGPIGRTLLKQAITDPGQSDYFKLNGAALLWIIGGLDEAQNIAAIWHSTRLEAQSNYVFYTAFEAAMKQDEKALPMLLAVLGNNKFKIYVVLHAMDVAWPMNMHFIWGAYGPKGLPILLDVMKKSQDTIETQSALMVVSRDQYLDALPRIRELAQQGSGDTRRFAIYALGLYGHPQDYDFLIAGLGSPEAEDRFYFAMAVYEYEDLRAVPHLIPLLHDSDQKVRREAFANLTHLLTSQSVDALVEYGQRARGEEKSAVDDYLKSELKEYGLTLPDYQKKSPADRAKTIDSVRRKREAGRFHLEPGEKPLSRDELLKAAEQWKRNHRMPGETAHLLSAATVSDIELLLQVKAAVLFRLSDECLYEAERITAAIKRLGRSRYRKEVGITEKVEAR